jgi:AAA15 family ATPase/GTPase
LINGENNTGKTSLLEALAIFANNANVEYLCKIIEDRGERLPHSDRETEINAVLDFFSSIFTDRDVDTFDENTSIVIGEQTDSQIKIRFVLYSDEITTSENGERERKRIIIDDKDIEKYSDYKIALMINSDIIPVENFNSSMPLPFRINRSRENRELIRCEFISTNNIDKEINANLFDNIALTEQEDAVIEALNIIDENIEGLAFIDDRENVKSFSSRRTDKSRNAVVKLKNNPARLPIQSMGDGINRILTIVLAMVNCQNGFLLVDEFENGLHYKVQEKLWKTIFKLAKKLNVQVFATTHSNDCINSFSRVLNDNDFEVTGQFLRLDNVNGVIQPEIANADVLKIADEQKIELR